MKTSAALIIKSAKELLEIYEQLKSKEQSAHGKAEKFKFKIMKLLGKIPTSEGQLHKEKIDAIIKKLI